MSIQQILGDDRQRDNNYSPLAAAQIAACCLPFSNATPSAMGRARLFPAAAATTAASKPISSGQVDSADAVAVAD